jgi:predicted phosphodiesterase
MKSEKLIEIKKAEKVVFVGDTHGDLEASQKVIKEYLKPGNKIVFLGDYVDRGPKSKENLDFLLEIKDKNPKQVYLLQGNHEGHRILKFSPANFWESLNERDYKKYSSIVEKFPLALVAKNIISLHGVLPDVKSLAEINKIKPGSKQWQQIAWGDFLNETGEYLGTDPFTGRPQFGQDYFLRIMKRFKKKVLIRSHQPNAPLFMFDNQCLTIFTSSAYAQERTIAIADFKKSIKTAKDLEIKKI